MNRYGTYSTFDCPIKDIDKAFDWLKSQFEPIKSHIYLKENDHDFGSYSSFEIDYPKHLENVEDDFDDVDDETEALITEKENWEEKADKIETDYNHLFMED